jgi:hypothetical protein
MSADVSEETISSITRVERLLAGFLLDLHFGLENGGDKFLRIGGFLQN